MGSPRIANTSSCDREGVPHEALGVGYSRSQAAREAAKPLYFAGKA